MSVHDVTVHESDLATALTYAAALESQSEHPIARAIARHANDNGARAIEISDFESTPGSGVAAKIDGIPVLVGSPQSVRRAVLEFAPTIETAIASAHQAGRTAVLAAWNGRARVVFSVGDSAKPESARTIAALKSLGLEPWLLTGDAQAAAENMAKTVGIDHVIAEVRPEEKVAAVERLKAAGKTVAMVGDGVNDSAALASADLGMAMGTGTDAAINAADITLVRGDLRSVADAVRLSRKTLRIIKQNLFWAFAYNVIGIPIAAAGLLDPMYAGVAMAASSLLVVSNALRLRRFQPLA
jgi:Cu+-exporting ATPase